MAVQHTAHRLTSLRHHSFKQERQLATPTSAMLFLAAKQHKSATCTYLVHLHLSHDAAEVWVQQHLVTVFVHGSVGSLIPGLLVHQSIDVSHVLVQLARGDDGSIGDLKTDTA